MPKLQRASTKTSTPTQTGVQVPKMANIGGGLQQLGRGIADLGGSLARVEDGRNRDEARQAYASFTKDLINSRNGLEQGFETQNITEQTQNISAFTQDSNKEFDDLSSAYMKNMSEGAKKYFTSNVEQASIEQAKWNAGFVSRKNGEIAKVSAIQLQDTSANNAFVNGDRQSYEQTLTNYKTDISGDPRISGPAEQKLSIDADDSVTSSYLNGYLSRANNNDLNVAADQINQADKLINDPVIQARLSPPSLQQLTNSISSAKQSLASRSANQLDIELGKSKTLLNNGIKVDVPRLERLKGGYVNTNQPEKVMQVEALINTSSTLDAVDGMTVQQMAALQLENQRKTMELSEGDDLNAQIKHLTESGIVGSYSTNRVKRIQNNPWGEAERSYGLAVDDINFGSPTFAQDIITRDGHRNNLAGKYYGDQNQSYRINYLKDEEAAGLINLMTSGDNQSINNVITNMSQGTLGNQQAMDSIIQQISMNKTMKDKAPTVSGALATSRYDQDASFYMLAGLKLHQTANNAGMSRKDFNEKLFRDYSNAFQGMNDSSRKVLQDSIYNTYLGVADATNPDLMKAPDGNLMKDVVNRLMGESLMYNDSQIFPYRDEQTGEFYDDIEMEDTLKSVTNQQLQMTHGDVMHIEGVDGFTPVDAMEVMNSPSTKLITVGNGKFKVGTTLSEGGTITNTFMFTNADGTDFILDLGKTGVEAPISQADGSESSSSRYRRYEAEAARLHEEVVY